MKKWMILWMIGIMCISLCACRPADGEGNGSLAGESELAPETETQQPETPEEAQPPVETEQEATGEDEGEEATTEETATETTEIPEEDPAIRAEAERIYHENGVLEYSDFCRKHDIIAYCYATTDECFMGERLIVRLKKSCSALDKTAPDFSIVDPLSVEEKTYYSFEITEDFQRVFYVQLKTSDKQKALDAIKLLETLDFIQEISPDYYGTND